MNYKVSFQERTRLGMEQLSQQQPVTLKEAREQALWLKKTAGAGLRDGSCTWGRSGLHLLLRQG
jgi:hypothetical protein